MIRRLTLTLAFALMAGLVPALAQSIVPPPVPALPDTERRTTYNLTASTCACAVNFALYGDSTDYGNWIEVYVNSVLQSPTTYTITSPTGPLGLIPRPITDAVLTLNSAVTGTVQIVGARRPRRVSQFSENRGVPARDLNQVITDIVAQNRETWDKINDVSGRAIVGLPGETLNQLPPAAARANFGLCFDNNGNPALCLGAPSGSFAAGSGINFSGTNPTTISAALTPTTIAGASTTFNASQNGYFIERSNSGAAMSDTLPGSALGILPAKTLLIIKNADASGLLAISAASGATLQGPMWNGFFYLGPGQSMTIYSDGANYWPIAAPHRAKLAANTTINIATTGSDTTANGLTAAFATTARAWAFAQSVLDHNGFVVTYAHAAGNYPQNVILSGVQFGSCGYTCDIIKGDTTTPSNVTFPGTGTGASITVNAGAQLSIAGLAASSAGGQALVVADNAVVNLGTQSAIGVSSCTSTCNIVGVSGGAALTAVSGGVLRLVGNLTINGNESVSWYAHAGGRWNVEASGLTVTLTGSPLMSSFVTADGGVVYLDFSITFSGSAATGTQKWATSNCGAIISGGTTFPGNVAGVPGSCGQFD